MCADWFFMFLWYRDHTAYYAERIFTIGWCGNKYSWDVYRMGDMEDRMQVSQNMSEWKVLILSRNNFLEFQYSICGEYRAFWIIAADIYDEEPFWCDRTSVSDWEGKFVMLYLLGSSSRANPSAGSLSVFFLSRTGTSDTVSADPSRFSYRLCFSDVWSIQILLFHDSIPFRFLRHRRTASGWWRGGW